MNAGDTYLPAAGCAVQQGTKAGQIVMGSPEHVGILAARQRQERYWNALQLRTGYRGFQV